jgi:hypothetical protein
MFKKVLTKLDHFVLFDANSKFVLYIYGARALACFSKLHLSSHFMIIKSYKDLINSVPGVRQ